MKADLNKYGGSTFSYVLFVSFFSPSFWRNDTLILKLILPYLSLIKVSSQKNQVMLQQKFMPKNTSLRKISRLWVKICYFTDYCFFNRCCVQFFLKFLCRNEDQVSSDKINPAFSSYLYFIQIFLLNFIQKNHQIFLPICSQKLLNSCLFLR